MSTITTTAPVSTPVEALPNGDVILDEILAASGRRSTAAIKRAMPKRGRHASGRPAPKVMFEPRGWTMGGRVD